VITLGALGAVLASGTIRAHLAAPDLRGRYPVGSGDAFLGGLALALVGGASFTEAARFGLAAGIANAQLPGAGALDPMFVAQLVEAVELYPI
jgi:fructose-1-phosphate kinase PfkB-like protein